MKQYKIYLSHAVLQNFTEMAFFIFGSLLFYLKTGSVLNTLFFVLVLKMAAVVFKSFFVLPFLKTVKALGVVRIMVVSLFVWGASLAVLFWMNVHNFRSLVWFFVVGAVFAVSESGYWILSNAFGFYFIGVSSTPGQYSAYWQIAIIMAGAAASLAGLFLHLNHNFILLLLLMGAMLIASAIPLRYLASPQVQAVSFRDCLKKLSLHGFLANTNPDHTMTTIAVPLIILFSFGSLSKSVWISSIVALITMLFVYLVGLLKDQRNNKLAALAGLALILGNVIYGFVNSPAAFIFVGILVGVALSMLDTAREACLGRELTNNEDAIAGTVAVEFARSFGGLLGILILIISYEVAGYLWQPVLAIGAVTVLPKLFYAIKNVQNPRGLLATKV